MGHSCWPKGGSLCLASDTAGEIQVIVNVGVLTEGWDYPPISCVVLLRSNSFKSTMIQMVGRGLRIVDSRQYPDTIKKDCVVLDFGVSSLIHGTLEQDLDLSEPSDENKDNIDQEEQYEDCPECDLEIPINSTTCPFCDAVLKEIKEAAQEKIRNFAMREIDMLAKSKFAWGGIPMQHSETLFACGFEAFVCIFPYEDHFVVVGGGNQKGSELNTEIIYKGDKATAISQGNDFLYNLESESVARKSARWRCCPPSEGQISTIDRYLSKYSIDSLTQGDVSNIISFEFSAKKELKKLGYSL